MPSFEAVLIQTTTMILDSIDKVYPGQDDDSQPVASGSNPTFTDRDHLLLDIPAAGLGPPPEFALYEAEHFEVGYEDVVSHDPHLNTDGK